MKSPRYLLNAEGVLVEGNINDFLPNVMNPELLTQEELQQLGIYVIYPPDVGDGYIAIPTTPLLIDGEVTGGWEVVPDMTPKWGVFIQEFYLRGSTLYDAIASVVQIASLRVQEHWSNFRVLILSESYRTPELVTESWNHLKSLLENEDKALSDSTVTSFELLARSYHIIE